MQLPVELIEFKKWVAFKGPFPTSDKYHRIIVMRVIEDCIEYFYVTSQISKALLRNKYDKASVTRVLTNADWDFD